MNFLEALNQAKNDSSAWFRPVSFKGSGTAFCVENKTVCMVPTPRGASPYMVKNVELLLAGWEVITADIVLDEREGLISQALNTVLKAAEGRTCASLHHKKSDHHKTSEFCPAEYHIKRQVMHLREDLVNQGILKIF